MFGQRHVWAVLLACLASASRESVPAVELKGSPFSPFNGVFHPTAETVNGHVAYKQSGSDLWFCMDSNGFWNVQPTAQKGSDKGFVIAAVKGMARPDSIKSWRVWEHGDWTMARKLAVAAVAEDADSVVEQQPSRAPASSTTKETDAIARLAVAELALQGVVVTTSEPTEEPPQYVPQDVFEQQTFFAGALTHLNNGHVARVIASQPLRQMATKGEEGTTDAAGTGYDHRSILMATLTTVGVSGMLYIVMALSKNKFLRAYSSKMVSAATTLFVGQFAAQCLTGFVLILSESCVPAIENLTGASSMAVTTIYISICSVFLLAIFVASWFAWIYAVWYYQDDLPKRQILCSFGTDIIGFVGFACFYKVWLIFIRLAGRLDGGQQDGLCGFAAIVVSLLFLKLIDVPSNRLRAEDGPLAEPPQKAEEGESRDLKVTPVPIKEEEPTAGTWKTRGCDSPFKGVRACDNPFGSMTEGVKNAQASLQTKISKLRGLEVAPEDVDEPPAPVTWQNEVWKAQNKTIGVIEAVLLFNVGMLLWTNKAGTMWGPFVAIGGLVALSAAVIIMSRDNAKLEESQGEIIFIAVVARIYGLIACESIIRCVLKLVDIDIVSQLLAFLIAFCFATAILFVMSRYIMNKNPDQKTIGVLIAYEYHPEKEAKDEDVMSFTPQEIPGLGIMLSTAGLFVMNDSVVAVTEEVEFFGNYPVASKTLLATLVSLLLATLWYFFIAPAAWKTAFEHQQAIDAAGSENVPESEAATYSPTALLEQE